MSSVRIPRAFGLALCLLFCSAYSCFATTRHYYIAAEEVNWNYAPSGRNLLTGTPVPQPWSLKLQWAKTRYIEYTDDTFNTQKPQPEWLGILGPIIRAEVGDEIVVDFLNRTHSGHDIHPHGLRYDKNNEGSLYLPVAKGGLSRRAPGIPITGLRTRRVVRVRANPVRSCGGTTLMSMPRLKSTPGCWDRSSLLRKVKRIRMDLPKISIANLSQPS